MNKVLIVDTSILCVWLRVPNFETCGSDSDRWDYEKVNAKIEEELSASTTFVLPLATIIETGNHIAQSQRDPYTLALSFAEIIRRTANNETPWAAFTAQSDLWSSEKLNELAEKWPELAASRISLGDVTIKDVAEYYAEQSSTNVEIFTGDEGLKAYEPLVKPAFIPRRRK
jgi:hypothetical protein